MLRDTAMSGYLSGIVAILCINLIFAYGIFVPAAAGQINLGGAGFQAIGAYSAGWLSSVAMLPVWMTIPLAMLIGGLIGFLISFPVLRTRGVYMVLATFAFGEAVAGFLLRTQFFGGAIGMVVPAHVEVSILMCSALTVTLLTFYLMATRFGLAMRSTNDDEAVTVLMGVNVRAVQVAAFTIGGAFAGLSGALYAHNFSFVEAQYFNSLLSIYVLLFVLIGGVQTAWGPLVGTLFFTLLPEFMRVGGSWRYVVFGAAIVLMMMLRPQGIVTRAMIEQLSPLRWGQRRAAVGALHER
jgi:branched-chain amino acid transport system permease protein